MVHAVHVLLNVVIVVLVMDQIGAIIATLDMLRELSLIVQLVNHHVSNVQDLLIAAQLAFQDTTWVEPNANFLHASMDIIMLELELLVNQFAKIIRNMLMDNVNQFVPNKHALLAQILHLILVLIVFLVIL